MPGIDALSTALMTIVPTASNDPITATLNSTIIAYIVDMVSKHEGKQDKDVRITLVITKPYPTWADTIPFHQL